MFKKSISFLNMSTLPGKFEYIPTESLVMAWKEATVSQCLPLLLAQVKLQKRELWVSGLDALTVTLLAAASMIA